MVLIKLEFSSNIFWMFAGLAGGLPAPPGPLVVGGPAAGPLGPGGPPGLFPPAEVGGWLAWSPEGAGLDTGGGAFGPGGPGGAPDTEGCIAVDILSETLKKCYQA